MGILKFIYFDTSTIKKNIKKILFIGIFFFFAFQTISKAKENDTIHVSTFGGLLRSNVSTQNSEFKFYKLESSQDVDSFKVVFHKLFNSEHLKAEKDIFLLILEVRKWKKENVYIILTPPGDSIKINQPFHIKEENKLIFTVSEYIPSENNKYPNETKRFYRIYSVDKSKDRFRKFLKYKDKLVPIEFQTFKRK